MLETLLYWDQEFFLLFNEGVSNPVFDAILPWLRNKFVWAPLYLFLIVFFLQNFGKKGAVIILGAIVTIAISDPIASQILKPWVDRARPCHQELIRQQMNLLVDCGGVWSFPSNHATNHFALAVFLGGIFWRLTFQWVFWVGLLWAGGISFAQVYVGVHFPGDVLAGGLLGATVGALLLQLYRSLPLWLKITSKSQY